MMAPVVRPGASLSPTAIPLTPREALSGTFGSISLVCWIFLLVPQLLENYHNHSASAISLPFILLWFLGDVCNMVGSAWAGLLPTVVAIAVYFCATDGLLIGQWLYYWYWAGGVDGNDWGGEDADADADADADGDGEMVGEEEPLLARQRSGSITIPGAGQTKTRKTMSTTTSTGGVAGPRRPSGATSDVLKRMLEDDDEGEGYAKAKLRQSWTKNSISLLGIIAIGTAGWAVAWASGAWTPTPSPTNGSQDASGDVTTDTGPLGAQILGYASAAAYLSARVPQIVKNARQRSCQGLSLLFFILSLTGNLTYGAGIMFHSLDRDYLITNTPWLLGSLGTMVEDVIIFVQFRIYARGGGGADDEEAVC